MKILIAFFFLLINVLSFSQVKTIENIKSPNSIIQAGNNNVVTNKIINNNFYVDGKIKAKQIDTTRCFIGESDSVFKILILPFYEPNGKKDYVYPSILYERLINLNNKDSLNFKLCFLSGFDYNNSYLNSDSAISIMKKHNADLIIYGYYSTDNITNGICVNYCSFNKIGLYNSEYKLKPITISAFSNGTLLGDIDYIIYNVAGVDLLNNVKKTINYDRRKISKNEIFQLNKAIKYFKYINDSVLEKRKAYYKIAYAYYLMNDTFNTKLFSEKAISIDSTDYNSYSFLASVFENQKDFNKAIDYISIAIKLAPDSERCTLLYNRAMYLFDIKQFEKSIEDSEKAIEDSSLYELSNLNIGNCYFEKGEDLTALNYYFRVLHKNPHNDAVYLNIGNCYYKQKKIEKAIEYYNRGLERFPNDPLILNSIGGIYFEKKDFNKSIQYFNKGIAIDSNETILYLNRGTSLLNIGMDSSAINDFNVVISREKDNLQAYRLRGISFLNKGEYHFAINDFNYYLEIFPDSIEILANRAIAYLLINERIKAKIDIDSIFSINKKDENFKLLEYLYYIKIKDKKSAFKIIKENPQIIPSIQIKCIWFFKAKQYEFIIDIAKSLIGKNKMDETSYKLLIFSLMNSKNFTEAEKLAEKAIKLFPDVYEFSRSKEEIQKVLSKSID